MKSARNAISGIIIGIMLTVTATAAVQEYTLKKSECKLVVDGVEVKGELPLLIMDPGYNYIPAAQFRSICDKIGIGFEFDVPTKEVRIETRQAQIETKEVEAVKITETPDGIKTIDTWHGKQYIGNLYIRLKANETGYTFIKNRQNVWEIIRLKDNKVLLTDIPTTALTGYGGYAAVEVNYYIENIMPIIGAE